MWTHITKFQLKIKLNLQRKNKNNKKQSYTIQEAFPQKIQMKTLFKF